METLDNSAPRLTICTMPRLARMHQQAVCYHLFNRGINRETLFHDEADFLRFCQVIVAYRQRCDGRVYHWALMSNHYHLLVRLAFPMLRRFAGGIQQAYAQYHHRRHGTSGVVWRGRYSTRPVEEDLSLTRCGRYIERNPVRAGLAAAAWDWRFSSAGFYALGRADMVTGLTDLDPQYAPPGLEAWQRAEYAAMLRDTADELWMAEQRGPAIGSAAFAARWLEEWGRLRTRQGRPPVARMARVSV